jgi:hypothetical protein
VTLKFGGEPKKLSVPYAAITRFYDPSVQYLLQFEPPAAPAPTLVGKLTKSSKAAKAEAPAPVESDEPKVVSLDQFRKK